MNSLLNFEMFLSFLGGFFSLIFTVVIIFVKQEYKRNLEREKLREEQRKNPEAVGDIEAKLDDSFEYRRLNFWEQLTLWGLQPLFIVCFVNLFSFSGTIEITITFSLVVLVILHEFWIGLRYSHNRRYQLFILVLWIGLFFVACYRKNTLKPQEELKTEVNTTKKAKPE